MRTLAKGKRFLFGATVAVVLNGLLFAAASLLSRDRAVAQDMSDPVPVSLISLKPPDVVREETVPEPPKPQQKPQLDFVPELVRPMPTAPQPLDVQLSIDPSLFVGSPVRGEFVFRAEDLDQAPQSVVQMEPRYPTRARHRQIEGLVDVKFMVNVDGSVGTIEILAAQPEGIFEAAVLETVARWTFKPGRIDGKPVPCWVVQPVSFTLTP